MKTRLPFEFKITLIYVVIGASWILFSDRLLYSITNDLRQINILSIYKGWLYVLITGILLFVLIKREIKKRNQLYDKLLASNKKASESERLKSAFLSNLSHYIRTPMNSILGFADLIQSRNLDEVKRNRFLTLINEKSHHLLQTINNIIEISKIQEGQVGIEKRQFSIHSMFNRLIFNYEQEIIKKDNGVMLYKNIALTNNEDEIISDYEKLSNILSNLLSNAVNFTEKGEIELGVKVNNNQYIFYVRDTGKGISSDKQKSLFVNFMQGQSDIQNISEGSGLGLYLSSSLVKLLGGNLWVESANESGSLFCFSIPIVK